MADLGGMKAVQQPSLQQASYLSSCGSNDLSSYGCPTSRQSAVNARATASQSSIDVNGGCSQPTSTTISAACWAPQPSPLVVWYGVGRATGGPQGPGTERKSMSHDLMDQARQPSCCQQQPRLRPASWEFESSWWYQGGSDCLKVASPTENQPPSGRNEGRLDEPDLSTE
eukprot:CAMPEP_0206528326 /NCGR_PEP_ID=MMETSP0325_2-20121206/1903_1 /ASSEMBLY_ACC=CAM_ASM_000347 /TAXON_ID=2866 /ORGANISM="Crypthecodinium cohnii, Strain Seligo" /LENGTH=169 /DNA_ID=CAMNT_0054023957 /DNA_START=52 /DNA_END=562 /DNA_ORIENTATION=+